jgi:hypothetical protein
LWLALFHVHLLSDSAPDSMVGYTLMKTPLVREGRRKVQKVPKSLNAQALRVSCTVKFNLMEATRGQAGAGKQEEDAAKDVQGIHVALS